MKSLESLLTISGISWSFVGLGNSPLSAFFEQLRFPSQQGKNVNSEKTRPSSSFTARLPTDQAGAKSSPCCKTKGYRVVSVQNPTTSLVDDVAVTNPSRQSADGTRGFSRTFMGRSRHHRSRQ